MILVDSDVIVVGAGPTGSYSAFQAAKLGAKVTICEEHNKIGAPTHCTGHISLANLKRLNLNLPKKVFENKIKSAIFNSPSGYQFSIRFGSPVTCVINRELFDQHLSDMASKTGVKLLKKTHVDSFSIDKGYVRGVVVKRKKRTEKLASRVAIDAEGVSSALLKQAGFPSLDRHRLVYGVQAEADKVEGIDEDTVEVFLSQSFAPGFYAWIVPLNDGTAKVGLATAKGNPRDCLTRFIRHNPIARKRLQNSNFKNLTYHPISLDGPISPTYHNGLLIVGDAASQVKPTTGGGIIMGLTCARIAGQAAAYAVRYKDASAYSLSEYERRWKKKIGFDMLIMKRLRLMLSRLSDSQLDKLIALCSQLKLEETLRNVRDVDFQGTSLICTTKSPRFLTTALYFLLASLL